jgi:CubicO group peptidase (beta-lactamase class C family)
MDAHNDFLAVDRVFAEFHAESPQPALAYGVVAGGQLIHSGGFGGLTVDGPLPSADSVFRIASMTKSFTAVCLLGLRDEGALSLDDPVSRYVPELTELAGPTADSPQLTLRSL